MPRTAKQEAPVLVNEDVIEGRYVEIGPYTVAYETYKADVDPAPFFRGLPNDRCQCPHWGTVVTGRLVIRYAEHEETFQAGDAYYIEPDHLPLVFAGAEIVEFSPTAELGETMAVLARNLEAAKAGT